MAERRGVRFSVDLESASCVMDCGRWCKPLGSVEGGISSVVEDECLLLAQIARKRCRLVRLVM